MSAYYTASRSVVAACFAAVSGWKVEGREHVPAAGGLIVASNHVSFFDPPLVGSACPRELHFLAKDELFRVPVLGALIRGFNAIPIKRGVADLAGMSRAIEVLKRGEALLLFPEGSRMRDGELHPARPGLGMMAVNADVPIVPCYVSGSDRARQWWNRRTRVRISFGPPRGWRELAGPDAELAPGRALYQSIGEGLMREIAALRAMQSNSAVRGPVMSRTRSS